MAEIVSLVADLKDNVSAAAFRVIKAIDDIGDKSASASPKVKMLENSVDEVGDAAKRTAAYAALSGKAIKGMGGEALKAEIKMRLLERRMKKMSRAGAMGGAGGRGGRGKSGGGGGGGMGLVAGGVGGMPITAFIAAASTIAALLPALSAGVGALGAAALGAVGALAPLSGLLIAYPGYLIALGQGLAVTKLAFSGIGDAVKVLTEPGSSLSEINAAMNKLGPSGQQFAKTVAGMKDDLDGLKETIQAALLPAFNELANTARAYMPMVESSFQATAGAIASATNSFRQYLEQARTQSQVGKILANNTEIVTQFSAAGVSGIKVLVDLLVAAGPMLTQISRDIRGFVDRLSQASGANTSGLSNFFSTTYDVLTKTVDIASDFIVAIYNIARIGTPLGSAMGDSFSKMAENFRAFTESAGGVQKIRDWFVEMTPVVYEIGYLIRDVSKALFGLGSSGDSFITISQALRQDLLPLIMEFINSVSAQLIPTLLDLVTTVVDFFTSIDPLRFIIPMIIAIAGAFKALVAVIDAGGPPLKFLVGALVAMMFTVKTAIIVLNLLRVAKLRAAVAARTLGVSIRTMMIAAGGIGLALTAIGLLISGFEDQATAADDASEANKAFAESLFEVNGALKDTADATLLKEMTDRGMLAAVDTLALGNHDLSLSYGTLTQVLSDNLAMQGDVYEFTEKNPYRKLRNDLTKVMNANANYGDTSTIAGQKTYEQYNAAKTLLDELDGLTVAYNNAYGNSVTYSKGLDEVTNSTNKTRTASQKLIDSMRELDKFFTDRQTARAYRQDLRDLRKTFSELGGEYGKNQLKTDQMDASLDQFVGNQMERANKLAEEGNYAEAFKVIDTASNAAMGVLTKNLGPSEAAKAFDPIKTMIDETLAALKLLETQQVDIKVNYSIPGYMAPPSAPNVPNGAVGPKQRFAGGPIVGGRTYMVGELGPEAFVGRNGNVSMIGAGGPEITRFPQGGYVVPNHVLGGAKDSSVPSNVMSALASSVASRSSGSSSEYEVGDRSISVHIGSISQATEFDVAKAVKKGILEAERNRRERS